MRRTFRQWLSDRHVRRWQRRFEGRTWIDEMLK